MIAEIDTNLAPPDKRLEYWQKNIASIFNLRPRLESLAPKGVFEAKLRFHKVDRLNLISSSGTGHRSVLTDVTQKSIFAVTIPLQGTTIIRQDGRTASISPGAIGLYYLGQECEIISATDYHRISIHIPSEEFRENFPACSQITAVSINTESGTGAIFVDLVKSLYRTVEALNTEPMVATAIADAVLDSLRAVLFSMPLNYDVADSRIEVYHRARIKRYVKANLRTNLSVESIARGVDLSVRHVHELFSREPLSLMKWVWAERLEHCRQDLSLPALHGRSISEIAYSWGFNDPAHLSRMFKSHFGKSPTQYRYDALYRLGDTTAKKNASPRDQH